MSTPTALHSKKTVKWGTPKHIIELARTLLGQVDLDPASSAEFNSLVQATLYYTEQTNGLSQPWAGKVFCNPPGGLICKFWDKLMKEIDEGNVDQAFWVGFSVEQLCLLADPTRLHPLDFSMCTLRKRLAFNTEQLDPGDSPSHGNYIVGLGVDHAHFEKLFAPLGKVTRGPLSLDFKI